ncbi:MAG: hypothetical protein P8188_17090 [Gemmatimonadota bacterium]|jgi:protein-tyrosine-phosphatase
MAITGTARQALVRLRDRIDQSLHAGRRERAAARLTELNPSSVLFVCLGNVCRSPYAERVFVDGNPGSVRVDSAGFIKPGRPPADLALEVAAERGIHHSDHRSRTLAPGELEVAEAVFLFDRFNKADLMRTPGVRRDRLFWLGDLEPEWQGRRAILDPWGKPRAEFERVFDQIERCVAELQRILAEAAAPAGPSPG